MSERNDMDPGKLDRWITGNYGEDQHGVFPDPGPYIVASTEVEIEDLEGQYEEGEVTLDSFVLGGVLVDRTTELGRKLCDAVLPMRAETIVESAERQFWEERDSG